MEKCEHRFINLYDNGHWHCRECTARGNDLRLAVGCNVDPKKPVNLKKIILSFISSKYS